MRCGNDPVAMRNAKRGDRAAREWFEAWLRWTHARDAGDPDAGPEPTKCGTCTGLILWDRDEPTRQAPRWRHLDQVAAIEYGPHHPVPAAGTDYPKGPPHVTLKRTQVEELFPVDGPHGDDDTREAAQAAAYLLRYLNHATLPSRAAEGICYPSTIDAVVHAMAELGYRLPQFLGQIADRLEQLAEEPGLGCDSIGAPPEGGAPALTAQAAAEIDEVRKLLASLGPALGRAQLPISRLTYQPGE